MRLLPILAVAAALGLPQAGRAQSAPVVVELYTSQGCASCPPADALLREIAAMDGVIALALHVDYWDYLGWPDAFALPQNTERQRAYAKAARSRTIFTPQVVVQGSERMKGHDAPRIEKQIAAVRQMPVKATVGIEREGDRLEVEVAPVEGAGAVGPAEVHLVRFRPEEAVSIAGGENAGVDVVYSNIVTSWETIGHWDGTAPAEFSTEAPGDGPLAVIVQADEMGPVLTAASWP